MSSKDINKDIRAMVAPLETTIKGLQDGNTAITNLSVTVGQGLAEMVRAKIADNEALVIQGQDGVDAAGEIVKAVVAMEQDIDALCKTITKPSRDAVAAVNGVFKPILEMLDRHKRTMKQRIYEYGQKVLAEQMEAQRLARLEAEKLQAKADRLEAKGKITEAENIRVVANATINTQPAQQIKMPAVNIRTTWSFCYTDKNGNDIPEPDMSLIPLEYHIPNEKLLGDIARSTKGTLKIAGVRFYSTKQ